MDMENQPVDQAPTLEEELLELMVRQAHQPESASQPEPTTQNSSSESPSAKPSPPPQCPKCLDPYGSKNLGILGWKQPENYPLSEITFCDCATGQRRQKALRIKADEARQRLLDRQFANSGIPPAFRGLSIESLTERCQNDRGKLEAIQAAAMLIEKGFFRDPIDNRYKSGIILSGSFGVGKTGLLTPVLAHFLEQGKVGLWVEMYGFLREVQNGYSDNSSSKRLDAACDADIILLDDFGDVERNTPETDDRRRILYELINHRHNNGLPMLITTNLDEAQCASQFGRRIIDRIMESCAWVEMAGRNLR